jgi:hypothetical protein
VIRKEAFKLIFIALLGLSGSAMAQDVQTPAEFAQATARAERLRDKDGKFEQAFIRVSKVADGVISGQIASDLGLVKEYRAGQSYSFPEAELIDWVIVNAQGAEEGKCRRQVHGYLSPIMVKPEETGGEQCDTGLSPAWWRACFFWAAQVVRPRSNMTAHNVHWPTCL